MSAIASAYNYSEASGGYEFFFGVAASLQDNINLADQLKAAKWTDKATRLIELKFALYNGLLNVFSFVKITFDFDQSGVFLSGNHIEFQSIAMEPYRRTKDKIRLVLEVIFTILVSNQICNFFHEKYKESQKARHVKDIFTVWMIVDAANLTLLTIFIILRVLVLWLMAANVIVVPTNEYQVRVTHRSPSRRHGYHDNPPELT